MLRCSCGSVPVKGALKVGEVTTVFCVCSCGKYVEADSIDPLDASLAVDVVWRWGDWKRNGEPSDLAWRAMEADMRPLLEYVLEREGETLDLSPEVILENELQEYLADLLDMYVDGTLTPRLSKTVNYAVAKWRQDKPVAS